LSYHQTWRFALIQTEKVAFQELAVREMVDAGLPVTALVPVGDKESRFAVVHQRYALGLVWHNETLDVEYENEMLSFPLSENDDWLDSTALALSTLFRELRTALSDEGSGASWSSRLGHEKKPKSIAYDRWGNAIDLLTWGNDVLSPEEEESGSTKVG
jgi:hypothetical protein